MPNCNFNGINSGRYYPCQICTNRCNNACNGNSSQIVKPELKDDWSFFAKEELQDVEQNGNIIFAKIIADGTAIVENTAGTIDVTAGIYAVNYSVCFTTTQDNQTIEVALFDDENQIANSGVVSLQSTVGTSGNLSKQIIFKTENNSQITLRNVSTDTVGFSNVAISIFKIAKN